MKTRCAVGLQAAIVDLDGTLVDTLGDFEVALNRTLVGLMLPAVDRAFIERTVGKGSEHLLRSTLAAVAGDASLYDAAWAHTTSGTTARLTATMPRFTTVLSQASTCCAPPAWRWPA